MHTESHHVFDQEHTTDSITHDGYAVQELTDDHIVVNSHKDKDKDFEAIK
jgi:hypothetical protein